jgi:hypothetical protein
VFVEQHLAGGEVNDWNAKKQLSIAQSQLGQISILTAFGYKPPPPRAPSLFFFFFFFFFPFFFSFFFFFYIGFPLLVSDWAAPDVGLGPPQSNLKRDCPIGAFKFD